MNPLKRRALGFVLQMPMEGDSYSASSTATPSYVGPDFAAPAYVDRSALQAAADEAANAAIKRPTFVGGPTNMNITPIITGGWSGAAGPEGDRSYTPTTFEGYKSYDPATRMQYGWGGTGEYLGSQYIPEDDPWSGVKDFVKGFVLPAVGMYTGVNALGGLFGPGGALGASAPAAASTGNLPAIIAGSAPGAVEAATAVTSPLDLLAAGAAPAAAAPSGNLAALISGSAPGAAEAAAAVTSPLDLLAASSIPAAVPSGNMAALIAGSAPGAAEAASAVTSPFDLLAAGAGATGSVPMAIGNEAVASGMSPGSLGAKAAAENVLLDSQLAAMYGTPAVSALTGGADAAAKLLKSANEAVASGMSPGSVGAAQAAAGMLTDAQLAAAYGVASKLPTIPKLPSLTPSSASPTSQMSGLSYADPAAPAGYYKTVGQMGNDTSQQKLQQLYSGMATAPVVSPYTFAEDVAPEVVDVAKMAGLASQPSWYAEGGTVETTGLMKSLKELGALGSGAKAPQHNVREIRQMGTATYSPRLLPQLAALLQSRGMTLAEGGQPSDQDHPNYDGLPVFRTGGLSGLGGKYVQGKGDGTSDDISAMLADGEYVFSADVVSALGNGSNKAGADKLSEMVHAIRSRARSATPDKLPPDAKSPLEYLKSSKGKKNG